MMEGALALHSSDLFPAKIQRQHRERSAIVYIRQSTVQQVERHQESTRLQYALVERAFQFGWARETIIVIDDDLGRSGATIEGRLGFQRLVAEVGLGNVGLVLGVEMSRLARSCRDWHQLLEICALFDTLIADADGHLDIVLDEIGHDLANGPEPLEQIEHQTYRRLRLLIGIEGDITRRPSQIAHGHRLTQLASLGFCPPACQHTRLENVQFRFRHRPL